MGLRDPPFGPHVEGVCLRKSTKFVYHPRVTILSPHLTEIIPLHDHLWQPQKQEQTHLHVTVQPEQSKDRTTGSSEYVVAIDFFAK